MSDKPTSYAERDAAIVDLQSQLFDYTGHVRRGLGRASALDLVAVIDLLRHQQGWEPLDMRGRWRRLLTKEKT